MGRLTSVVSSLEPCCSTIRNFSSLRSQICFLDLQKGKHLSELGVGEKCSEKRNSQPALLSCEEESGETSLRNIVLSM